MSSDSSWISDRVGKAREPHPLITDAAARKVEKLLNGQLSEGELTPNEREDVASELLNAMRSEAEESEVYNAD